MRVAIFSTKNDEKTYLLAANQAYQHELVFFDCVLNSQTVELTKNFPAVSCFVTDQLSKEVLSVLKKNNSAYIALRSAGFNHVDLTAAKALGLTITRVPDYSPYAVAEFAVGLILNLNRKIHRAYQLVKEQNFLLSHLLGFDLHGKTVGIIGTGKIGSVFAKIMHGFGCKILATDPVENHHCIQLGVEYVSLKELCGLSDIISLHCPLNQQTRHIIHADIIASMKLGVMLINTGRGALIDTQAVIAGLKSKQIGYLGMDVYEEEESIFFQDLSDEIIQDDVFMRLQSFPNVIITGHQAYYTKEALTNIAEVTLRNLTAFEQGKLKESDKL